MPKVKVGKKIVKKFPYTKAGKKSAKTFAKKVGGTMEMSESMKGY